MKPVERKLLNYISSNGKCPFEDWFNRLKDRKGQMLIDARLLRLRQGNLGQYRALGAGVKELKIAYGLAIESTSLRMETRW